MHPRLLVERMLGRPDVAERGPGVGGCARHLAVGEVRGRGSAVLRSQLELRGGGLVERNGLFETVFRSQGTAL